VACRIRRRHLEAARPGVHELEDIDDGAGVRFEQAARALETFGVAVGDGFVDFGGQVREHGLRQIHERALAPRERAGHVGLVQAGEETVEARPEKALRQFGAGCQHQLARGGLL